MIRGIGTDVLDIRRVEKILQRRANLFMHRVLSPAETEVYYTRHIASRSEYVAGRFAAKEAIAKAIGCGLARLGMAAVDISLGAQGLTVTWLGARPANVASSDKIHVSISHTAEIAFATAIWEA